MEGRESLILAVLILLFSLSLNLRLNQVKVRVEASNDYPVHNLDTGLNYTTIQAAIDANETSNGHTILVEKGTYYENVIVDKSLSLVGENRDTIIDGQGSGDSIRVMTNSVNIESFTLRNCNQGVYVDVVSNETTISDNTIVDCGNCGIFVVSSSKNNITHNSLRNNPLGIYITFSGSILSSFNNLIEHNNISNNSGGIKLSHSHSNTIRSNNIENNSEGISLGASSANVLMMNKITSNREVGISLGFSSGNKLMGNIISNSSLHYYSTGIYLQNSFNNTLTGNNIAGNSFGIVFSEDSFGNIIIHNNLFGNSQPASIIQWPDALYPINAWHDDYPSGGNCWSNYNGTDLFSGPYQNETGSDGIGDTAFVIGVNNTDYYPLMGIFSNFNSTLENYVQTICNSTISDFQFNGTAISFNVAGEDGTSGFCRVVIPTAFMKDTYRVFVNGTEVSYTMLPVSNSTHGYLYFTYNHSIQEIVIVSEFPSLIILSLFMIATLLPELVHRRRKIQQSIQVKVYSWYDPSL